VLFMGVGSGLFSRNVESSSPCGFGQGLGGCGGAGRGVGDGRFFFRAKETAKIHLAVIRVLSASPLLAAERGGFRGRWHRVGSGCSSCGRLGVLLMLVDFPRGG